MTQNQSIDNAQPAGDAETVRTLTAIYSELLQVQSVDPADDFFILGGNSVLAARLTQQVESRIGVRIPPRRFYQSPTVAGLTRVVNELRAARVTEPAPAGSAD